MDKFVKKEYSLLYHLPVLIPIIFDADLEIAFDNENVKLVDNKFKEKMMNQMLTTCVYDIKMSEVKAIVEPYLLKFKKKILNSIFSIRCVHLTNLLRR